MTKSNRENNTLMSSTNRYTFSGKEKQTIRDLGWLDFSARMLSNDTDPPRWTTQDPLSEKYYSISPYAYCAGNPIRFVDPTGMDWYSYEEKYEEDGEEKTRIQYKYVQGTMSDDEMKEGGYTHLGKTYLSDGKYYSLGGAVLDFDKRDMESFNITANVMLADLFTILAVNAFESGADFWGKYNEYISTGSNAANAVVDYMDSSLKFGNYIRGIGYITGGIRVGQDFYSAFISKTMTKEGFIDAAVNVISTFGGGYAAGFGFMYNQYKNAGKFLIRGVNEGEIYLRKKYTDPATYLWGW